MLAEHPLHGDEFGPVLVQPRFDALLDGDEAQPQLGVRRGPYDTDADHGERPARDAFDDTDTASRQTGVHPEYPHARPLPSIACLCRLAGPTDKATGRRVCPVGPLSRLVGLSSRQRYASTFSMTSSLTSKLAKTFCTSSLSSRASISLKILRAPSSSSSTCMVGTKLASAES